MKNGGKCKRILINIKFANVLCGLFHLGYGCGV